MGKFLYCKSHLDVHKYGEDGSMWCSAVDFDRQCEELAATTRTEAYQEAKNNGWPLYNGKVNWQNSWNVFGELMEKPHVLE